MSYNPPITGDDLLKLLEHEVTYSPIIEGLFYEEDSSLISSAPGLGKSMVSIQLAMELSSGSPAFGGLYVPKPRKVWYIQMERSLTESLSRVSHLKSTTDFDAHNLFIDTELQAMNWLKTGSLEKIIERGKTINADVIFIDPLYGIASGLSKDEVGSDVAKLLTIIKKELKCAFWINHHTTKDVYDKDGKKIEKDDPFYGAQWLKAHVTGSYIFKHHEIGNEWNNKKDSHFPKNMLKDMILHYDEESGRSVIKIEYGEVKDRLRMFFNLSFRSGKKSLTLEEITSKTSVSQSQFFRTMRDESFRASLILHKSKFSKTLYEVIKEF